jgi:hypothetical protein
MGWAGETGGSKISKSGPHCRRHQTDEVEPIPGRETVYATCLVLFIGGPALLAILLPLDFLHFALLALALSGIGLFLMNIFEDCPLCIKEKYPQVARTRKKQVQESVTITDVVIVVRMFGMLGWMMFIGGALLIVGGTLLIVFSLAFPMEAMEEALEILRIGGGAILLGSVFLKLDEIATLKASRRGK